MASTWKQISYNFLFFLAGLQSIPKSVIEAAAIDGARPTRRFWTIIFPLLSPTAFFLLVVNIVYVFFDTFGIIDAMTGGGPSKATETLVYKVFFDGRLGGDLGGSAAQSVIADGDGDRPDRDPVPLHRAQGDVLMAQSVLWKELTAEDLRAKAQADAIVVLPVASIEQHGPHLPVGVDTILTEAVCQAAAEAIATDTAGRGRADALVRHGRASHGVRRHLHVRHPDLSRGAALLPEEHRAARLQTRAHRQRPRRQHRRPHCLPARLRARDGAQGPHGHLFRRRPWWRWPRSSRTRRACITPARRRPR